MLGVLWYIGCIVAAFIWLMGSRLYPILSLGEIAFASIPVGTIMGAWFVYLVACCLSAIEHQTMIIANLAIILVVIDRFPAFMRNWRTVVESKGKTLKGEIVDTLMAAGVVGLLAIPFVPLYSSRMIPTIPNPSNPSEMAIMSGGSCWADLPIHMHIAESFLSGRNMDVSWGDMHSPVFAGEKMYYPFLPDFHAAVITKLGSSLRQGFLLPGLFMSFSFWALLLLLAVRVTKSRLAGVLAIVLTIGAGGMGGVNILLKNIREQNGNIWTAITRTMETDTAQNDVSGDGKVFWFAFLPHVFLPQRGANFAYPMALLVLLLVWKATDMAAKMSHKDRRSLLVHAALFTASLPLVQAHAFMGLGLILAVIFLLDSHKWIADLRILGGWVSAGIVAIALGYPQMSLFRGHVEKGHGGHFIKTGWIFRNHDFGREGSFLYGFFRFWWYSLGPALPLFLLALATLGYDSFKAYLLASRELKGGLTDATIDEYAAVHAASNGIGASSDSAEGSAAVKEKVEDIPLSNADGSNSSEDVDPATALRRRTAGKLTVSVRRDAIVSAQQEEVTLTEHIVSLVMSQLPDSVSAVITGRRPVRFTVLDKHLRVMNALSMTGRSLDAIKLCLGGMAVFLVGNYVNFQPWDRDNCKLFYLWVFIYSIAIGALLAAPLECLFNSLPGLPGLLFAGPGAARINQWLGSSQKEALDWARSASSGAVIKAGKIHRAAPKGSAAADEDSTTAKAATQTSTARKWGARSVATAGALSLPVVLFLTCLTGFLMVFREYGLFHVMLDKDQMEMGNWIKTNLAPKSVVAHRDVHITPSGSIAGRPALIGYNGWMWSHGYNYYDRDRDRNYMLANALKDSDQEAYNSMRRWGVRYLLGEWLPRHHRAKQQEWEEAKARQTANPEDTSIVVPNFDPDLYLDGNLKRLATFGRYEILEVLGYGFSPN